MTILPLLIALIAPPSDLNEKSLKQTLDDLLPGMGAADPNARKTPQQKWQEICNIAGAPGNEKLRVEACKQMASKLTPQTPAPARIWLLLQLERIGREECIEAVAVLLNDKDDPVRDAAVRCLVNNPNPQATTKLVEQLPKATGKAKVGLVNALGQRKDKNAGDAVAKELASEDSAVAIAAARALGRIATPEATKVLAEARGKTKDRLRLAIGDAYLLCADQRLKEGKLAEAAAIYKELNRSEEARPLRLAALQGVLKSGGEEAGTIVLDLLAGNDADARAIAISQIEHLNAGALKPLAEQLEKLPVPSQVLVLTALAARGEKSQVAVALKASKSTNDSVKRAGLLALGKLGDASVAPVLIEALSTPHAGVAADSLVTLPGTGINEKLTALLNVELSSERLFTLIDILERRKADEAVGTLLKTANHEKANVRMAVFASLKTLAEPKHVPEMVLALLKTEKGKEREQAEQAIVAVCARIAEPEKRAESVLAMLNDGAKPHKATLLPLVGRLGGMDALKLVRDALADTNADLHHAAVAALCNWPDPTVSEDLLKLAESEKTPDQRLASLQAAIRVNTTAPVDRPMESRLASLAALKKAMTLCMRDDESKAILDGIGFVRTLDTLRYVVSYLDHKTLNQSACRAVVELAHSRMLREPNQEEFNKVLDRVIKMCKDPALVERARQYRGQ